MQLLNQARRALSRLSILQLGHPVVTEQTGEPVQMPFLVRNPLDGLSVGLRAKLKEVLRRWQLCLFEQAYGS